MCCFRNPQTTTDDEHRCAEPPADAAAAAILAEGSRPWYQYVTVEPTMFLYMLAFMLTSVVEQAFFLHKACLVNHGFTADECDNLDANLTLKKAVQVTVSDFHQWNNIASHVVPIVLALFLGAWSDKRGRKLPLLCGLVGKMLYSVMVVVNASQRECSGYFRLSVIGCVLIAFSLPPKQKNSALAR